MSDITAGDLAVFLEANPGPHRIGRYVVEHIGRFDLSDGWLSSVSDTQDGPEPGYESPVREDPVTHRHHDQTH